MIRVRLRHWLSDGQDRYAPGSEVVVTDGAAAELVAQGSAELVGPVEPEAERVTAPAPEPEPEPETPAAVADRAPEIVPPAPATPPEGVFKSRRNR